MNAKLQIERNSHEPAAMFYLHSRCMSNACRPSSARPSCASAATPRPARLRLRRLRWRRVPASGYWESQRCGVCWRATCPSGRPRRCYPSCWSSLGPEESSGRRERWWTILESRFCLSVYCKFSSSYNYSGFHLRLKGLYWRHAFMRMYKPLIPSHQYNSHVTLTTLLFLFLTQTQFSFNN